MVKWSRLFNLDSRDRRHFVDEISDRKWKTNLFELFPNKPKRKRNKKHV